MFIHPNLVEIFTVRFNTPEKDKACFNAMVDNTTYKPTLFTFYDNSYSNVNLSLLWNYFIERSPADYIVLLNNDTRPTGQWLDKMMETMLQDKRIGAVGPSTNRTGNPHQQLDITDLPSVRTEIDYAQYSPNAQLDGFCMLIRKDAWMDVGQFNPDYDFFGQESEFMFLLQQKGWKTVLRKDAYVWHDHHASAIKAGMNLDSELSKAGKLYWAKVKSFNK